MDKNTTQRLIYTVDEVMEATRASRTTIYKAINEGRLIALKNGRRTVFKSADVASYIDSFEPVGGPNDQAA